MNTFLITPSIIILFCVIALLCVLMGIGIIVRYVHLLQLQGYHVVETYLDQKIILYKYSRHFFLPFVFISILGLAFCILSLRSVVWQWITMGCIIVTMLVVCNWLYSSLTTKYKVPLNYTKRIKRVFVIFVIVSLLYFACMAFIFYVCISRLFLLVLPLYFIVLPFLFCFALGVSHIIEKFIFNHYYIASQKKCLSMDKLVVIGITGSYGKTSTKHILAQLLDEKYHVLATQKSYNTPMGIAKVVLGKLNASHEIFIAEMGADHKNDIKVLTNQVHPTIGILTSVGSAHLKTFGSIYEILRTKYQLIEGLPADGYAVFNGDCDYELALIHKTNIKKGVVISNNRRHLIDEEGCENVAIIEKVSCTSGGASISIKTNQFSYDFTTKLLGRHQATNIASAILVAEYLNVPYKKIVTSLQQLKNVEHRLSMQSIGQAIILDDSFNCNIEGASNALEVLSTFDGYEKIVITPGIVEGGTSSASLNRTLGSIIAKIADSVVIVNTINKIDITKGIIDENTKINIHYASNFEEAKEKYMTDRKAVYLLLNDLPDQYE